MDSIEAGVTEFTQSSRLEPLLEFLKGTSFIRVVSFGSCKISIFRKKETRMICIVACK